jgi:hypothetical protein
MVQVTKTGTARALLGLHNCPSSELEKGEGVCIGFVDRNPGSLSIGDGMDDAGL